MLTPTLRGHIFGALAIIFVLLSFAVWKYVSSGPRPPSELQIQEMDFKSEGLISSHAITIPKGRWYDTGIWVGPWRKVYVYNPEAEPKQPFEVQVGDITRPAVLATNDRFHNWLFTADDHARPGSNVSYIGKQAKIYLSVSDDATTDKLKVNVKIWSLSDADKKVVSDVIGVIDEEGIGVVGIILLSVGGIITGGTALYYLILLAAILIGMVRGWMADMREKRVR